jgi:hypothetical protein
LQAAHRVKSKSACKSATMAPPGRAGTKTERKRHRDEHETGDCSRKMNAGSSPPKRSRGKSFLFVVLQ